MTLSILFVWSLFLLSPSPSATAADKLPVPLTVVELFTSQGCYSCPPADTYLGYLSKQENTITLACHVTYWNYLGWRDTFSRDYCDQRQRRYQALLQGRQGVYTPQIVVNGRYGVVGSRSARVDKIIDHARRRETIAPIDIQPSGDQQIKITLPTLSDQEPQQLWLLGTTGEHLLPISRGENGGKRLRYHDPVEQVIDLGLWAKDTKEILQKVGSTKVKKWIVIAQNSPMGAITAAGQYAPP
ncbi:MAG: DUF1223 domain-containing protein [Pseudomonadota bacterium]